MKSGLKAAQGGVGRAQIGLIIRIYAHIQDGNRKLGAQKFESAFYAAPGLRSSVEPMEPAPAKPYLESLAEQLRRPPELANTLAALLASDPSGKWFWKIVLANRRYY